MTRAMRKRLAHGLRWPTAREPGMTWRHWLAGFIAALVFLLIVAILDSAQANAELSESKAQQIRAEVALVNLLNEKPLIGSDGVVIAPRIETITTGQIALAERK